MSIKTPRVLLIAEAANPDWVSVPLVGWRIARAVMDRVDAHLVTHVRNKAAIEATGLRCGEHFSVIDNEFVLGPIWKLAELLRGGRGKGWTTLTALQSLAYPSFEYLVWRKFGAAIRAGAYDLVHRITPLSPTSPSLLARRCQKAGVPFLLGPLNGGIPWPEGFNSERNAEREWLSYVRGLYGALPGIRATYRNASVVLAASSHTEQEVRKLGAARTVYVPENGVDSRFIDGRTKEPDRIDLCFIGRLVPYKGPDIAILSAQPLLASGRATLTFAGDGPMRGALGDLVDRLGLSERVRFLDWVDHADLPKAVETCNLLLFPSVREFGGGAVVEALALGLVPLVVDYGGPGEVVTEQCGFKVPVSTRRQLVANLRAVLNEIAAGRHDIARMAAQGRSRVRALYTWPRKGDQITRVYDSVLKGDKALPHYAF